MADVIVIFDLDGTVWDSEPGILACMAHALDGVGHDITTAGDLRSHIGPPLATMLANLGVPEPQLDEAFRLYRERYLSAGVFEASLYDGVIELLAELEDGGHTLATATSKGSDPTMTMLEHFGLTDRFAVIGAASMDDSCSTKAQVLGRTLAELGQPDPGACVLVGDRDLDVLGAAGHGVDCIGAAWGFGGAAELAAAGAGQVAATPADVAAIVARR